MSISTKVRAAEVLDALARHRDLSDSQLGRLAGMSRQKVQQKRKLGARISLDDIDAFCMALNVEPVVFMMEPSEAIRWVLDNAPTLEGRSSTWDAQTAGQQVLAGIAA